MPATPLRQAIKGRIVTMNGTSTVLTQGIIYIEAASIVAVSDAAAPAPPNFTGIKVTDTKGTIYPGLIELHNHLSYNALKTWQVPKKYTNRDQWGAHPDYRKLISGPMNVLGRTAGYPEAVARYVEAKCLLGGVTTSQGIALFSNSGITRYYRGLVRNVEETAGKDMPAAPGHIADVLASDAEKFQENLKRSSCLLLHLCEGTDDRARKHFDTLKMPDGSYAINNALAGIHCVALKPADYRILKQHGGSMIWSPLSNLLLYGQTADVQAAKAEGITIGIGSDWSPSGSKNLLGELKIARLVSAQKNHLFSDQEIIAMATRNAAQILKWDKAVGSLETGKRADLIVVKGKAKDPYAQLLESTEKDLQLVMIDGVARYGIAALVTGDLLEPWRVGGAQRVLNLGKANADLIVENLSLKDAANRLTGGLHRLVELAKELEKPKPILPPVRMAESAPQWFLQLDHEEPAGMSIRTRFAPSPQAGSPQRISSNSGRPHLSKEERLHRQKLKNRESAQRSRDQRKTYITHL